MGNDRRIALLNVLTIVVLIATVCLVCFYSLVAFNAFNLNPFPPPPLPTVAVLPTATETPTPGIPTWTPTPIPTITPIPKSTNTRTPTLTPSVTPTWPPTALPTTTATPTPEVTRSPWPFTHELILEAPQYGCNWTGVAGHVQDLDENSLMGYAVHIWGAGIDQTIIAGADTRHNTIYGNQAAWEQFFDVSPKPMEVRVRLHDNQGRAISEEIVINLPGYCNGALGYIVFTKNH